jgi:hypothetical protein
MKGIRKIEIDEEVFAKLRDLAVPFEDTTPNHVIRRLIGLPPHGLSSSVGRSSYSITEEEKPRREDSMKSSPLMHRISQLQKETSHVESAFLTFIMDKYLNAVGNYKTSEIVPFFEAVNLVTLAGSYRNPWMQKPYKNLQSCLRTVEHYRQCRKYGCWEGRDIKSNCDKISCEYHPSNDNGPTTKCDLRKGVIWKRQTPESPSNYGNNYIHVVRRELLHDKSIPLRPLLSLFYADFDYSQDLVDRFIKDYHLTNDEISQFFV